MKSLLWAALLCLGVNAYSAERWFRCSVEVNSPADVETLEKTDLIIADCTIQLGETDMIVSEGQFPSLLALGLKYRVQDEIPAPDAYPHPQTNREVIDYKTQYLTLTQMIAQMETWRSENPGLITRQQIGTTIQNRPIWAYRIYAGRPGSTPRRAVVVSGLTHAREWITGSSTLYITDELIRKSKQERFYALQLQSTAVWVVPCLNPDGYEFTQTNRYWRKNRRQITSSVFGVDLNRNFPTGFGGAGSSGSPSNETYRGTSALSEPESQGYNSFMANLPNLRASLDLHSYSQLVLLPWSYTTTLLPLSERNRFSAIGNNIVSRIAAEGGVPFVSGQTANILYIASGTTADHFYASRNVTGLSMELRDTGQFGFVLPESQILGGVKEAYIGFDEMFRDVVRKP